MGGDLLLDLLEIGLHENRRSGEGLAKQKPPITDQATASKGEVCMPECVSMNKRLMP